MRDLGDRHAQRWALASDTRSWLVALSLAVGLAVGGCSDDGDDPSTLPDVTPTGTASETASPEPTATSTPTRGPSPEPDSTDALEAEITEFLEEYVSVSDDSWSSKQALKNRREMFANSCSICLSGYEFAEKALSNGWTFEGDPGKVVDVTVTAYSDKLVSVLALIDAPEAQLLNSDGDVVERFASNIGSQVVYQLRRGGDGRWILIEGEALS